MQTSGHPPSSADRQVHVQLVRDGGGHPKGFSLTLGTETIHLDPGKSWIKVDVFKWVTRGLIEAPQSFHVTGSGEVDINGEHIRPQDPDSAHRLEQEINKHHPAVSPTRLASPKLTAPGPTAPGGAGQGGRVQFRVHLDMMSHLVVEARRGQERVETGLRGIQSLIQHGLMIKPGVLHVDPLQRAVEIDGHRFECNAAGARELEHALNQGYAPRMEEHKDQLIEVHDNSASPTGFDLGFPGLQAGTRIRVEGHLSQERLEILTDTHRCELLRPGVVLKISPPRLLFRRRRTDGGEEGIPELPDLDYMRCTAEQLQTALNHPIIRRRADGVDTLASAATPVAKILKLHLVKHPQNRLVLWLECHTDQPPHIEGKAFTHHNIADLQHRGVFRERVDVSLSLDNQRLSVLDQATGEEQHLNVSISSPDQEIEAANRLLNGALPGFPLIEESGTPVPA